MMKRIISFVAIVATLVTMASCHKEEYDIRIVKGDGIQSVSAESVTIEENSKGYVDFVLKNGYDNPVATGANSRVEGNRCYFGPVSSDATVKLSASKSKCFVRFEIGEGINFDPKPELTSDKTLVVETGTELIYTITPALHYSSNIKVVGLNPTGKPNEYTTGKITEDITVGATATMKYVLSVTATAGILCNGQTQEVEPNENATFTFLVLNGFEKFVLKVMDGTNDVFNPTNLVVDGNKYTYTVTATTNLSLIASVSSIVYHTVTFKAGAGVSLIGNTSQTVKDGNSASISFSYMNGYKNPYSDYADATITGTSCTTGAIHSDVVITISATPMNKYRIAIENIGTTSVSSLEVIEGAVGSFAFSVNEGYKNPTLDVVSGNGNFAMSTNLISYSNVTSDCSIKISAEQIFFTVTIVPTNVTVAVTTLRVAYGQAAMFSVDANSGYENPTATLLEGSLSNLVINGRECSFDNVKANSRIAVKASLVENYTVLIVTKPGITSPISRLDLPRGGSASFSFTLDQCSLFHSAVATSGIVEQLTVSGNTVTFGPVYSNATIELTANNDSKFTCNIESSSNMSVSSSSILVCEGNTASFTFTAPSGYIVTASGMNATISGNVCTFGPVNSSNYGDGVVRLVATPAHPEYVVVNLTQYTNQDIRLEGETIGDWYTTEDGNCIKVKYGTKVKLFPTYGEGFCSLSGTANIHRTSQSPETWESDVLTSDCAMSITVERLVESYINGIDLGGFAYTNPGFEKRWLHLNEGTTYNFTATLGYLYKNGNQWFGGQSFATLTAVNSSIKTFTDVNNITYSQTVLSEGETQLKYKVVLTNDNYDAKAISLIPGSDLAPKSAHVANIVMVGAVKVYTNKYGAYYDSAKVLYIVDGEKGYFFIDPLEYQNGFTVTGATTNGISVVNVNNNHSLTMYVIDTNNANIEVKITAN